LASVRLVEVDPAWLECGVHPAPLNHWPSCREMVVIFTARAPCQWSLLSSPDRWKMVSALAVVLADNEDMPVTRTVNRHEWLSRCVVLRCSFLRLDRSPALIVKHCCTAPCRLSPLVSFRLRITTQLLFGTQNNKTNRLVKCAFEHPC
jgi:hypothetical protein